MGGYLVPVSTMPTSGGVEVSKYQRPDRREFQTLRGCQLQANELVLVCAGAADGDFVALEMAHGREAMHLAPSSPPTQPLVLMLAQLRCREGTMDGRWYRFSSGTVPDENNLEPSPTEQTLFVILPHSSGQVTSPSCYNWSLCLCPRTRTHPLKEHTQTHEASRSAWASETQDHVPRASWRLSFDGPAVHRRC